MSDKTITQLTAASLPLVGTEVLPIVQSGSTVKVAVSSLTTVNVQTFTADGTWTKPNNVKNVRVIAIGGGGGGGSGCKYAANNRGGGAGGLPGLYFDKTIQSSDVTSTVSVTIGAGGTGGASQTVDGGNGIAGTQGGNTTFGSYIIAHGGWSGGGGTNQATSQVGANSPSRSEWSATLKQTNGYVAAANFSSSGLSSAPANTGNGGIFGLFGPGGGGGGGTILGGVIATVMGYGGDGATTVGSFAGGSTSTTDGASGGNGTPATVNMPYGGGGGGGGQASLVSNAGSGGNGALYGGGGGGGGPGVAAIGNSGKGGDGASGICVVISW